MLFMKKRRTLEKAATDKEQECEDLVVCCERRWEQKYVDILLKELMEIDECIYKKQAL